MAGIEHSPAAQTAASPRWIRLQDVPVGLTELAAHHIFDAKQHHIGWFDSSWARRHAPSVNADFITSLNDGALFSLRIEGASLAVQVTRHEHSGNLEIWVNGEPYQSIDLYAARRDWLPTVFLLTGLGKGEKEITFRIRGRNSQSKGTQCWLRSFFIPTAAARLFMPESPASMAQIMALSPLRDCINIHARQDRNVGDLRSSPVPYFPFLSQVKQADMFGWHTRANPSYESRLEYYDALANKNIIIGGGGLLATDFFVPALDFIRFGASRKVVIWGAGHNLHERETWVPQFNGYTISAINYHLIGVRDYGTRFRWVPCASCMAPELTDPAPIIRPFGFFLHAVVNDTKNQLLEADPDIPFIDNFADFSEAIRFIGESETLITNSFHGAYWAALMGRKVIGIPTASKFFSFRHPVPLADIADWRSVLPKTFCYTDALEECRAANLSFAFDVHAALAD